MENKGEMENKPKTLKRDTTVKTAKDKDVKDVQDAKNAQDTLPASISTNLLNDLVETSSKENPFFSGKMAWININNEYLFPRTFLENCVVFVQRSGSTLIIRTTEDYNDLTTVLPSEGAAISTIRDICSLLNDNDITCNIEFGGISNTDGPG
jgi:hypothetical protein